MAIRRRIRYQRASSQDVPDIPPWKELIKLERGETEDLARAHGLPAGGDVKLMDMKSALHRKNGGHA